jgi:serine/threonine-protein kinase
LEGGQPSLRGQVTGTGGWDKYRQIKIGTLTIPAGTHRLILRSDAGTLHGALLDLHEIKLVPNAKE